MSQLLASGWESWIPLAAALWLASVILLIFSARKYFATRGLDRAGADLAPLQEPFIEASRTPGTLVVKREADTDIDDASLSVTARDDHAAEVAGTISREPEAGVESLFAAVRARIAGDPASAHGLSELIRALYLDQSNFTFQMIAGLSVEDRALAKGLIDEWLVDPSAIERWEEIYETVRERNPVSRHKEPA